jgi:DNA-binding MurR/RpiR family transcriptional regulator
MKLYKSAAWLRQRFLLDKKTIAEMAAEAQVTEMTIRRMLEKYGIK